jgi:hypothetical protein
MSASRQVLAQAEADMLLLEAAPPVGSLDALHWALGQLAEASRLLAEGCPASARIVVEDIETAMAAAEAFPPGSPESEALGSVLAAVQELAAGRAA